MSTLDLCVQRGMGEEIQEIKGDIKEHQDEIQEQKDKMKLYSEKIEGFGANVPDFMWRHLSELQKSLTALRLERAALRTALAALRPQHQGGITPPCSPCLGLLLLALGYMHPIGGRFPCAAGRRQVVTIPTCVHMARDPPCMLTDNPRRYPDPRWIPPSGMGLTQPHIFPDIFLLKRTPTLHQ